MTQKSWPWSTVAGLGDGAAELGEADTREFLAAYFGVQDLTAEGVSVGVMNELEVTGAASPLAVNTGSAICYGLYINDASVNLTVTTPVIGTTGGRVVLQTNWAGTGGAGLEARTRLAVIYSADGVAAIPALTQVFGTTWEISLATFTITTGGVIALTDDRTFRMSTGMVGVNEILSAIAGDGLAGGEGSALSVNVDGVTLEINADALRVKDNGITAAKIAAAIAGSGLAGGGGVALSVNVDGSTLEINADTLRIKDLGVTLAKLAADSVDDTKAGNRVAQFYRRQGGNAANWVTPGTTTYTPTSVRVQWGSIQWTGGAAATGNQAVTFPVAFSNYPVVFVIPVIAVAADASVSAAVQGSVNSAGFTLSWDDSDGTTHTSMDFFWVAIGPE